MLGDMELSYDRERVKKAIVRNLVEVNSALLKLTAYNKLCEVEFSYEGMSFFAIAGHSLYKDMIGNVIQLLDLHPHAESFWYIERMIPVDVQSAAKNCNTDIEQVKEFSSKLLYVKNKTHFHIDKCVVENSKEVWNRADISADEFTQTLSSVAGILAILKRELFGGELGEVTQYDGADIQKMVAAYEKIYGKVPGSPSNR